MRRASVCWSLKTWPRFEIGPAGTPAADILATQSAVVADARLVSISTTRAERLAIRTALVAKRGSVISESRPIVVQRFAHCWLVRAARTTYPSFVRKAWYGALKRCAEPIARGGSPVAQ